MSEQTATPLHCRCPNCGHRMADIPSGDRHTVIMVKCRKQGKRGCSHVIRFTCEPGSKHVIPFDLGIHLAGWS